MLKFKMVRKMAARPRVFALASPTPEITPDEICAVRNDAIIATGRADYPTQINNVLCFPYIFRGALDSHVTTINPEMEIAAVYAIAELAQAEQSGVLAASYASELLAFGPAYRISSPFDPRLMTCISPAVAVAQSGVALTPITDMMAYRTRLEALTYAAGTFMKPIFTATKKASLARIGCAQGEDERVRRACQTIVDEGLARPTLIGRPIIIAQRIEKFSLRLMQERDYDNVNVKQDYRYRDFWQSYHRMTERQGMTAQIAKIEMRQRLTLVALRLLHKSEVNGVICGTWVTTPMHLNYVERVISKRSEVNHFAGMSGLVFPEHQVFLVDTHVNDDPDAQKIADIKALNAQEMMRLGVQPKAALLSHANFASSEQASALKLREALAHLRAQAPWLEMDGEMAISVTDHNKLMSCSSLQGEANLLVFPDLDTANITYSLLKTAAGSGVSIGPILLGTAQPVHTLTATATVRRFVNMTALTVTGVNVPPETTDRPNFLIKLQEEKQ
jgi:malate dehydrogenase (oxaloacetate-decarboxylating)(NADP+)